MKRFFAAMSPWWRPLLGFAAWGVLIVLVLVSLPFLFDLMSRGIGWIVALFPHPDESWKSCPWCF